LYKYKKPLETRAKERISVTGNLEKNMCKGFIASRKLAIYPDFLLPDIK